VLSSGSALHIDEQKHTLFVMAHLGCLLASKVREEVVNERKKRVTMQAPYSQRIFPDNHF
jgi:hypothetical protein